MFIGSKGSNGTIPLILRSILMLEKISRLIGNVRIPKTILTGIMNIPQRRIGRKVLTTIIIERMYPSDRFPSLWINWRFMKRGWSIKLSWDRTNRFARTFDVQNFINSVRREMKT